MSPKAPKILTSTYRKVKFMATKVKGMFQGIPHEIREFRVLRARRTKQRREGMLE